MNDSRFEQAGVEIWRGGVTPWQCDEMGHMNVRFYLAIATEGLAGLAAALGMPRAFSPGASSTLLVREHHVRFLKEARPGAGLLMMGGVLSIDDTDAVILQQLFHASGEPAAAFTVRVTHVTPGELKPFPWPQSARRLAEALLVPAPDFSLARGLALEPVVTQAGLRAADALGLKAASTGAVSHQQCDTFGRMLPEQVLARIHASIGHVFRLSYSAAIAAAPELEGRLGGAAVEYRCLYHAWPRPGDRLMLRSGHKAMTAKSRTMIHWLLDPTSGRPWASAEMLSLNLDLNERKAVAMPESVVQAFAAELIPGLTL
jgi:acyl-CoA thioester hydrolase